MPDTTKSGKVKKALAAGPDLPCPEALLTWPPPFSQRAPPQRLKRISPRRASAYLSTTCA